MIKILKIVAMFVLLLGLHYYFYTNENIKKIDYDVYDLMMNFSNQFKKNDGFYTVVIEIDEKSIQVLGQWPWSRVVTSNLIDEINKLNPSALGINILFPEVDRISPINIQKFYKKFFNIEVAFSQVPLSLKDNDKLLLNSILHAKATIATSFQNNAYTAQHCQDLMYQKNIFSKHKTPFKVDTFLCNHKNLQNNVKNFGFINAWKDSDGIFRRVPLFMQYQDKIFPAFALATLLSFDKTFESQSNADTILLNFSSKKPKVFSAIDILNGKIPLDEIQGKVVVLGSSLLGLTPMYNTALGDKISNNMIHAIAIENLINDNFLRQPIAYKQINIVISLLLSLILIYLVYKRAYLKTLILFSFALIFNFLATFYFYLNNIYLSSAYFLLPFSSFFILLIFYHINTLNKEKIIQEKLLIKQNKLASMGEMISLIAHQWRQPLSSINGTVLNMDMDYRQKKLNAQVFDNYLNEIEATTAYLSKTIYDFTDFFSMKKKEENFYFKQLIENAKQLIPTSLQENIIIDYNKHDILELNTYQSELMQIMLVLLNNALYACQNSENKHKKILIHHYQKNKKLIICIEDNGGGISKKDLPHIFDPYFTTKETQHGTGLGLYILRMIIEERMNGNIEASNSNEGAIFSLYLPISIVN